MPNIILVLVALLSVAGTLAFGFGISIAFKVFGVLLVILFIIIVSLFGLLIVDLITKRCSDVHA